MKKRKKLIIHIGYPKTATKTLQKNVFSSLYANGEIEYLNHIGVGAEGFGQYVVKGILNYAIGFQKEYPEEELIKLKQINKQISVLSNESLAHVSEKTPTPNKKVAVPENLERLHQLFSPYFEKIEVVMTIRNQLTMVHSYYTQEYYNIILKNKQHKFLENWLLDNFNEQIKEDQLIFNYYKMYSSIEKYFGKGAAYILFYEDIIENSQQIFQKWANILNVSQEKIKYLFKQEAQNVTTVKSNDKRYTDKQSFGSKISILANRLHINPTVKKNIRKFVPKQVLAYQTKNEIEIPNFNEEQVDLLNRRFAIGNSKLVEELSLQQLITYNYPVL